ncbi:MAG: Uma2 family endonuclease [Acidobacteriota bacterium]
MVTSVKFTSADLELMPDDGKRYEIIEGELYVSRQLSMEHQYSCSRLCQFLGDWNDKDGSGVVLTAPGLIFGEGDDVAPDVVWITRERLALATDRAGHLLTAPELVIEVLSPGKANEDRDRRVKLKLYSRQGVHEHWIVDAMLQQIAVYRRDHAQLLLDRTLYANDTLESPLLPGFSCKVAKLFLSPPA